MLSFAKTRYSVANNMSEPDRLMDKYDIFPSIRLPSDDIHLVDIEAILRILIESAEPVLRNVLVP